MVDQLGIDRPELYWIRRSAWDLTPVMGSAWKFVPTNLPITEPARVNPQKAAEDKAQAEQQRGLQATGLSSHVPFETNKSAFPTNFLHALKK